MILPLTGIYAAQGHSGRDPARSSHVQHSSRPTQLSHARSIPARTMVQHGRTYGSAQHGSVHPVLVRTDDLCGEESGIDGDAYAALLGVSAVPLLGGARGESRGVGRKNHGLVRCAPTPLARQGVTSGMNA